MARPDFFHLQSRARRRTVLLLIGSFVILWVAFNTITYAAHVETGVCDDGSTCAELTPDGRWMIIGVMVVGLYILVAYFASARAALALSGARPATGPEFTQLRNIVEEMAIASGTPLPQVYVVDDPSPNAFATGRTPERAAVTVTTGLLQQMSRRELTGVIAHELAHIRNRDISVNTIAVLTAATIAVLADLAMRVAWFTAHIGRRSTSGKSTAPIGLVALVIAAALYVFALPAALLLRAALSRQRESLADMSAVQYTRDPSGIRSALEKLEADTTVPSRVSTATAHLWIDEPKPAGRPQRAMLSRMLDTHPPIGERIAVLRRMEGIDPDRRGPNDPHPFPPPSPPSTT